MLSDVETKNPKFIQGISKYFEKLQEDPDDVKVLKELGAQFLKHQEMVMLILIMRLNQMIVLLQHMKIW